MSRVLWWVVFNIPLGPVAPWVFGLAMGKWPRLVKMPLSLYIAIRDGLFYGLVLGLIAVLIARRFL